MENTKKPENGGFQNPAMTLRDYMACAVLPKVFQNHWDLSTPEAPINYEAVAKNAYDIADAMLKLRETK